VQASVYFSNTSSFAYSNICVVVTSFLLPSHSVLVPQY